MGEKIFKPAENSEQQKNMERQKQAYEPHTAEYQVYKALLTAFKQIYALIFFVFQSAHLPFQAALI